MILNKAFYQDENVVGLAKAFLGKVLCTNIHGIRCAGIITETEAYAGVTDKASHAYGNRHTRRTAPMYKSGGLAYVYLIYGIHSLFNIVTAPEGIPHAVLVRAIAPLEGIDEMKRRRNIQSTQDLTNGPGKLSTAIGIHYSDSGESLDGPKIWIEDRGINPTGTQISAGPRIGIDYAEEDAFLPYRFVYHHGKGI
jgi:DNA-3-methyladenine glycosylase